MCAKAEQKEFGQGIADIEADFPQWYIDVVTKAELAEDAPVRGCMVVRPYGYALWENAQANLDRRFKETGVLNAAFPLLIPQSFLLKEAEHVEGFAPEVAWVTHGGGEELAEPLAVRPTSEAIIGPIYSRWVQSYRDLPLLINQWCSVFRWEKRPRLFLRTAEFWWQEGHTVHASHDDCEQRTRLMLEVYRAFLEEELAIPVIPGQKSESQKFPGALRTYTVEAMMQDGRALQSGTSHNLGDHFARAFDIMYLNEQNERVYAWTTSWGMSTRIIGALIMVHGDKKGLVLPPRVAPYQAVVLPIWRKDDEKADVIMAADRVVSTLRGAGVRVKVDADDTKTIGWKHNEWELRGVPVRVAIGPKDIQNGTVEMARRDKPGKEFKEYPAIETLAERVPRLLADIQENLYRRALEFRQHNTRQVADMEELARAIEERQFADAFWCGMGECEDRIKEATKATNRCMPLDQPGDSGRCVVCGMESNVHAIFARAY